MQSRVAQTKVESLDKPIAPGYERVRYTGAKTAPVTYYSNGHPYTAANTPKWRFLDVPVKDVENLLAMPFFERVRTAIPIQPIQPPSVPIVPVAPSVPVPVAVPVAPKPPEIKIETPVKSVAMAETMRAAVAALEEKTGEMVQPKTQTAPIAPTLEIQLIPAPETIVPKKRAYKARKK